MKCTITFAAVAMSAAFAFAGYEDWYTPAEDFTKPTVDMTFWVGDKKIQMTKLALEDELLTVEAAVEQAVRNSSLSENAKNAFALSKRALSEAMFAQLQSEMNRKKIASLGASIETIFQLTNADRVDSSGAVISSGKLADGVRAKMLEKKNALIGKGGTGGAGGEGGETKPLQIQVTDFPYDTHEFEQIQMNENKSKMGLKGYKDLRPIESFPFSSGLYLKKGWIPFSEGYNGGEPNDLKWYAWGGLDTDVLDVIAGTEGDDGKITLKYWAGGDGGCGEDLQNLLTNKSAKIADDRRKHYFLTRYGDKNGGTHQLHWLSLADAAMDIGGEPNVDDHSIELTQDGDDSEDPKKLRLKGFETAKSGMTEDSKVPIIPNIQPKEDDLKWTSFSDFFAGSVFKTSETTGKVLLNGTSEGDKKLQVLALQYGDTADDQTLSSFSGDGKSIDFGFTPDGQTMESPLAQLHNFDNPERSGAKTEHDIADILTNLNHSTDGWYFPLRNAQGVLQYAEASKITGIPSASVDNLTIEATKDEETGDNDPEKLRIVGSKDAVKGQLLKMGDEGKVEWGDFPIEVARPEGTAEDEYPLHITAADPEQNEPAKIGINGWETTDSPEGLYGAGNGKPIMYRFADIKSLEADAEYRTVELTGYANAGNYSMAFKDSNNGLGWVAPPSNGSALLTMNHGAEPTATVLGNSVETETINNKVTLNIKGFTNGGGCDTTMHDMLTSDSQSANRSQHQVLTRYTGGSSPALHWVAFGDKVGGGGAATDEQSLTTNTVKGAVTEGLAGVYGFADAPYGTIPICSVNNGTKIIKWGTLGSFGLIYNGNGSYTINGGYYIKARSVLYATGTNISSTGYVVLRVPMASGSVTIMTGQSSIPSKTNDYAYIPLYRIYDGGINDYRGSPVIQAWE